MAFVKRLKNPFDLFVVRCFECRRVAMIGEGSCPVDGDDPRCLCRICGYRSVRLLMKSLDSKIALGSETKGDRFIDSDRL